MLSNRSMTWSKNFWGTFTDNNMKEQQTTKGWRVVWKYIVPQRRLITLISVLGVLSALGNGAVPFVVGRFFDALTHMNSDTLWGAWPLWVALLVLWAILQGLTGFVDWRRDIATNSIDLSLYEYILSEGYTRLLRLPVAYLKSNRMGDTEKRISQASNSISTMGSTLADIAPQFLAFAVGLGFVTYIQWRFSLILLVAIMLYSILLWHMAKRVIESMRAGREMWGEAHGTASDAILNAQAIKQACAEEYETERVRRAFADTTAKWVGIERFWSNISFSQQVIVLLTQLTIFILAALLLARGAITIGDLIALNGYAAMVFGPFAQLARRWERIQSAVVDAERFDVQHTAPTEVYTPEHGTTLRPFHGDVTFDNVSFTYPDTENAVLANITFTVTEGKTVALVGESGVGKSTAIELISGYYFPQDGTVLVSGVPTTQHDLTDLRRHIAVVSQEPVLFNDTIEANIRYGSFDASEEQVEQAVRMAHADEFIGQFPEKYKQKVGERGVKLSGGQKQRVAIARAVLRSPKILILDEPTSALDAKTEHYIAESLAQLMQGRTTFIIAHRLSTVRAADMILVFKGGRIVERGTHSELLTIEGGEYKRLHDFQIGLQ